jgi:hypothetical protein
MTALRTIVSAVLEAMAPDGTMTRMRFRTSLDMLLTLGITVLAMVLALGYQVVGRWARHAGGER